MVLGFVQEIAIITSLFGAGLTGRFVYMCCGGHKCYKLHHCASSFHIIHLLHLPHILYLLHILHLANEINIIDESVIDIIDKTELQTHHVLLFSISEKLGISNTAVEDIEHELISHLKTLKDQENRYS